MRQRPCEKDSGSMPLSHRLKIRDRTLFHRPSQRSSRRKLLLFGGEGQAMHVAGHLRRSVWQGRESVELLIEDAAEPHA